MSAETLHCNVCFGWKANICIVLFLLPTRRMDEYLFMFLAEGVAQGHARYRDGARHSMMIFACGGVLDGARDSAAAFASRGGWTFVDVKRGKQIDDPDWIEDDALRTAAEAALENGPALVVYADEIPADS